MLISIVLFATILALILASLEDLKTGEVSDVKSMGLLGFGLLISAMHSIASWNASIILSSISWSLAYFIFSLIIFKLGQWGGGDVKVMAALGAVMGYMDSIGYQWPKTGFIFEIHPLLSLVVNMAFISVPYAIVYTLILGLRKPKAFEKYAKKVATGKTMLTLSAAVLPSIAFAHLRMINASIIYLTMPLFYLATLYMKTVEETVLTKTIKVSDLRAWDILSKDLRFEKKLIATKRNIEGVTPQQVASIKKLAKEGKIPKTIDIRWGIKFLPVISLAFLATAYAGDALALAFGFLINP
jgi:Flp pilus assembly protein protease CpaA